MLRHSCLKLLTAPACSLQAGLDRGIEVEISAEQRATEKKKRSIAMTPPQELSWYCFSH